MPLVYQVMAILLLVAGGASSELLEFSKLSTDTYCSPRHLTIYDGEVYVAESGYGPTPVPNATASGAPCVYNAMWDAHYCWGRTASVSKIPTTGGEKQVVLSGLFSARYISGMGENHATGAQSVAFDGDVMYTVTGLGANGTEINMSGFNASFGAVLCTTASGDTTDFVRPWEYEFANNPDNTTDSTGVFPVPDSNPYHAVVKDGKMYVVDAGGNDIVTYDMTTKQVLDAYVIPQITGVTAITTATDYGMCTNITPPYGPPYCGQTQDTNNTWIYSTESVPVSVRMRPGIDDTIYVARLAGAMWNEAVASILEITLDGDGIPTSHNSVATGFYAIVDFEFYDANTMYVLESNPGSPYIPFSGRLTRVNMQDATQEVVAEGDLSSPSGVAIDGDTLFISNATYDFATPCTGEIIYANLGTTEADTSAATTTSKGMLGLGLVLCALMFAAW